MPVHLTISALKETILLSIHQHDGEAPWAVPSLEDAIALAVSAHRGQGYPTQELRREPFILHPLRVMARMGNDLERTVAALHDLVEDTDFTVDDLRHRGFSTEVIDAIDSLTHRNGESYEEYILRVRNNPLARRVKLADLDDNLANNRDVDPKADEDARMARYRHAVDVLSLT
jgi:(p)ppGpp synthase/HD superfamily hydrolase